MPLLGACAYVLASVRAGGASCCCRASCLIRRHCPAAAASCAARAGLGHHWERVLSILDDMEVAGVEWDAFTLSALLSACQACGQWRQAQEWFAAAQRTPGAAAPGLQGCVCCCRLALLPYGAVVCSWPPPAASPAAVPPRPAPRSPATPIAGLQLNVVHYTTLMSCLQKGGQWEASVAAFRSMAASGVAPDVVAHNAAIAACARVRALRSPLLPPLGCTTALARTAALLPPPRAALLLPPPLPCAARRRRSAAPRSCRRARTGRRRGRCSWT